MSSYEELVNVAASEQSAIEELRASFPSPEYSETLFRTGSEFLCAVYCAGETVERFHVDASGTAKSGFAR